MAFEGYYFRRWLCMHKHLFRRIVNEIATCSYFQHADARGTVGFTRLKKYTVTLRQLTYATSPDALDENLMMFGRTAQ